jgi:signal peptidase I
VNHRTLGCLLELLETLLVTIVVFLVLQLFVVQPYQVQQTSMENTLMPDQYVLVDKLTPQFDNYHRGDVVVFNPPTSWTKDLAGAAYVKRVIGIGGDTIDIHGGHVYVNGTVQIELYVFESQTTDLTDHGSKTWTLEPDQLFVLGDHRQASQDSREFGPIDKSSVVGRAWLRYWPLSQFGQLPQQQAPASGSAAPSGSARPSGSAASPRTP